MSEEPRIEIMPLVDVVFLLLTFFVFSLVLMVRADALNITLPRVGAGEPVQRQNLLTIAVDRAGALTLAGEPVTVADLGRRVRDRLDASPTPPRVVLAADAGASAGAVLRALDALAGAGVTDVAVLGAPDASEPDQDAPPRPP